MLATGFSIQRLCLLSSVKGLEQDWPSVVVHTSNPIWEADGWIYKFQDSQGYTDWPYFKSGERGKVSKVFLYC